MALLPVVRYMILCNDWGPDPDSPRRANIYGLLTHIDSLDTPAYPLLYPQLCVFLVLTEGHGGGNGQLVCILEESGERMFETPTRRIAFGSDPLDVIGLPWRIDDCPFPRPGLYLVQFWYDNVKVEERPLRLR